MLVNPSHGWVCVATHLGIELEVVYIRLWLPAVEVDDWDDFIFEGEFLWWNIYYWFYMLDAQFTDLYSVLDTAW